MHNWITFNPLNYFKHSININLKNNFGEKNELLYDVNP